MMKTLTKLTLICLLASFGATAQISTPAPSPAGSVSSTVGLTDISIEYFRPGVKGRQIFGTGDDYLLQYGQLWRTGANSGSKITFSTAANVGGTDIDAGTYMILTVPGAEEWEFILYGDPTIGGNMSRVEEDKKVVITKVKAIKLNDPVERMTFNIADISADNTSANIQLAWADAAIEVPVKVTYDDMVMEEIAAKTKVNPSNLISAANYYYSNDKDLNQALEWVNAYLASGDNSGQFWNVHLKANILAKLGKDKEAIEAATKSMEMAKANEAGDFGYVKRNEDLIAEIKSK